MSHAQISCIELCCIRRSHRTAFAPHTYHCMVTHGTQNADVYQPMEYEAAEAFLRLLACS